MKHDTFNPLRILEAVMQFYKSLGNGGEVAITDPLPAPADWKETLPDDIKADPIFEKYKEPHEAFRALVGAQKFLGREKLPVPADENDKETYDLIFKKLGLPENEAGYELPTDLKIPEGLPMDEALTADFKKIAHQHRLLPSQVSGLYKWYMSSMVDAYNKFGEQQKVSEQEAETALRKKTGAAYPQTIAFAKKVFSRFADEKAVNAFVEKGYGNDPVLIELFANIGKILSEDQLKGKPPSLEMTPDEAQTKINQIRGNLKGPLYDSSHPQHQEFLDEVDRLTKLTMVGQ